MFKFRLALLILGLMLMTTFQVGAIGCGNDSCFIAGTKILLVDGRQKNIEEVKVGDEIFSYDLKTGQLVKDKVLEVESPWRNHYVEVILADGTNLGVTDEHPLYTSEGWQAINPWSAKLENPALEVGQLEIGGKVLKSSGEYVEVVLMQRHNGFIRTYNLKRVAEQSNFYADGVLAHNKDGGGGDGGGGDSCEPSCPPCQPDGPDLGFGVYPGAACPATCGASCGIRHESCQAPRCTAANRQLERETVIYSKCFKMGHEINPSMAPEISGYIDCFLNDPGPQPYPHSSCSVVKNDGTRYGCYKVKTCEDIYGSGFEEYTPGRAGRFIPAPEIGGRGYGGENGFRCGQYVVTSEPWWQATLGNVYAWDAIYNDNLPAANYAIKADDSCTPLTMGNSAGLEMTFGSAGTLTAAGRRSNRPGSGGKDAAAYPAFELEVGQMDYSYFMNLVGVSLANPCNDAVKHLQADGFRACVAGDGTLVSQLASWGLGGKFLVFVNGRLIVDTPVITSAAAGEFKGFIVKNELEVRSTLGLVHSDPGALCPQCDQAQIQGFFVAENFKLTKEGVTSVAVAAQPFNPAASCDKQLTLAGTFLQWTGDIVLNRSFDGCNLEVGSEAAWNTAGGDLNAKMPAYTFCYRPDLLLNAPAWLKTVNSTRLEVR